MGLGITLLIIEARRVISAGPGLGSLTSTQDGGFVAIGQISKANCRKKEAGSDLDLLTHCLKNQAWGLGEHGVFRSRIESSWVQYAEIFVERPLGEWDAESSRKSAEDAARSYFAGRGSAAFVFSGPPSVRDWIAPRALEELVREKLKTGIRSEAEKKKLDRATKKQAAKNPRERRGL